jgi:hypothetical protein
MRPEQLFPQGGQLRSFQARRNGKGNPLRVVMCHQLLGGPSDDTRAESLLIPQHPLGRCLEIPNHAEPGQCPQDVISSVDLPPSEPLQGAALERVMIVVPALAHRKKRQEPVVAGIISRHIPLASANMREGIDAKGCVIDENRAPKESDYKARPPGNNKAQNRKSERRQQFMLVQPH